MEHPPTSKPASPIPPRRPRTGWIFPAVLLAFCLAGLAVALVRLLSNDIQGFLSFLDAVRRDGLAVVVVVFVLVLAVSDLARAALGKPASGKRFLRTVLAVGGVAALLVLSLNLAGLPVNRYPTVEEAVLRSRDLTASSVLGELSSGGFTAAVYLDASTQARQVVVLDRTADGWGVLSPKLGKPFLTAYPDYAFLLSAYRFGGQDLLVIQTVKAKETDLPTVSDARATAYASLTVIAGAGADALFYRFWFAAAPTSTEAYTVSVGDAKVEVPAP